MVKLKRRPERKQSRGRIVAGGMLREMTPLEDYRKQYGLWVKREDLACPLPGPPFSKTRGVYAHIKSRPEEVIGVLDTYHSQAGWAVARACQILGKQCINYYPDYKNEPGPRIAQHKSESLGATLYPLSAGRSAILFHQAKRLCEVKGGYIMPNALKLEESVWETAKEVSLDTRPDAVIIPISSGTIAAGVIQGFCERLAAEELPRFIIHLGYKRSHEEVRRYITNKAGYDVNELIEMVDEGYQYKDKAKDGPTPPWPCNEYYDLKTFRWWMENRNQYRGETVLFWNIG